MRQCGGKIRRVLLIQQILLCLVSVLGHDHEQKEKIVEAAPIRIAAPMDGWVLTATPVTIQVWARRPCAEESRHVPGCSVEIYLDGKLLDSTEPPRWTDDDSTTWDWQSALLHVRGPMDDGPHEVEVWQKRGGLSRLADSSAFFLHRGRRGSVWPWFRGLGFPAGPGHEDAAVGARHVRRKSQPHEGALAEDSWRYPDARRPLKSAVMLYHKAALQRYPARWINKCIASIMEQSYRDFDVFELDYGGAGEQIFGPKYQKQLDGRKYSYWRKPLDNHAEAMNEMLNEIFERHDYDVAFNVNIDDFYARTRFITKITAIRQGFDIVSSHFIIMEENEEMKFAENTEEADASSFAVEEEERFLEVMDNARLFGIHELEGWDPAQEEPTSLHIAESLLKGHNVLCHPGIAFGKRFWSALSQLECRPGGDGGMPADGPTGSLCLPGVWDQVVRPLRYRPELPLEDLWLWQRAIAAPRSNISVHVVPSTEVYYRIHEKSVSKTDRPALTMQETLERALASNFQGRLRVGVLTVCTGGSAQYLERHLRSVASLFMRGLPKFFFVYTDDVGAAERVFRVLQREYGDDFATGHAIKVEDQGYDKVALMRFHHLMLQDTKMETETDYVFYMGVDTVMRADIAVQEVLPEPEKPLVAVCRALYTGHGSLLNLNEKNAASAAEFAGNRDDLARKCWIAGGFLGGRTPDFVVMARAIAEGVDSDLQNGVTAAGCEEDAHLNKHFATFPEKYRTLAPSYLHPGTLSDVAYEPRIATVDSSSTL